MTRKRGAPDIGELVVCRITRINPNSAFANILEYGLEGMVHISEISSGWVRDIRSHIRVNMEVIAKVIRSDRHISLSFKRVDKREEKRKMKEYKLDQKAEKMLEIIAKDLGKNLDQAYEEVGYTMQESFGSLFEGFKKAMQDPNLLKERGIREEWIMPIKEMAEKSIEQKEFEFSAKLFMKTNKPNGIKIIKDLLAGIEKSGLEVKYISAPEYLVKYKSKDAKRGESDFLKILNKIDSKDAEIKVVR